MIEKIWSWLNGKKTTIACIYWAVVVPSLMVIWPDGYHTHTAMITYKVCTIFGFVLSAVGLGHAAAKTWMPGTSEVQVDELIAKEESEAAKTEIVSPVPLVESTEVKPQESIDATAEDKKNS